MTEHSDYLTRAKCSECERWSEPRETGTAPPGWSKLISPSRGRVTYQCDKCQPKESRV